VWRACKVEIIFEEEKIRGRGARTLVA